MNLNKELEVLQYDVTEEWTIQNKWTHILFWACYFSFWVLISGPLGVDVILINLVFVFYSIIAVYSIVYFFVPRLLYRNRYISFALIFVGIILFCAFLLGISLYGLFTIRGINDDAFFSFPIILGPTIGSVTTSVLFVMMAKLVKNYMSANSRNKILEHQKTENELKYLKSQLNPHFLFNALNNIYFLIKKDPDVAAESLAKFSDMLRYQLYECNEEKILLSQEIEYINNFVKISALGRRESTEIKIEIDEVDNHIMISPFVLFPIVENAFKHVLENGLGENFIHFSISVDNQSLICKSRNSYDDMETQKLDEDTMVKKGGLGIPNLKRRLSLMYPNLHVFQIDSDVNYYSTRLELNL